MNNIKECECELLGAWLQGYHTEHIKEFDYFSVYPAIFKAVKKTKDIDAVKVAEMCKCSVSEVAQITAMYMPSIYMGSYKALKKYHIQIRLENLKSLPPDEMVAQIDLLHKEVEKLSASEIRKPTDLASAYQKEIEYRLLEEKTIKFGMPKLDYVTGGLHKKELTVIAARPSVGKTAFALQTAFRAALGGHRVLFFPLEMDGTQLVERLICYDTDIIHEHLKSPCKMSAKELERMEDWLKSYKETAQTQLHVIEEVSALSDIERYIVKYQPQLVVIDQLSKLTEHMSFAKTKDRFDYMTNRCKAMTMKHNLPIVLLAQLGRGSENKIIPTLTDLKETGNIEEDADNVIMLHQKSETDINMRTAMYIIVRKQRNGQRDVFIDCKFKNDKFRFDEVM